MIREFKTEGMAVVVNAEEDVLWQLVKYRTVKNKTYFSKPVAIKFSLKKDAVKACKKMGFPLNHVWKGEGEGLGAYFYFIRYDFRYDYALACWEI